MRVEARIINFQAGNDHYINMQQLLSVSTKAYSKYKFVHRQKEDKSLNPQPIKVIHIFSLGVGN